MLVTLLTLITGALIQVPALSIARSQATRDLSFSPLLDVYITKYVRLTPEERRLLLTGGSVTKLLDADPSKEVSLFGAVWVDAPPGDYVRLVKDIERFERGSRARRHSCTGRKLSSA